MYKCKQNLTPPVFGNIFTNRKNTKCSIRNENSIQEPLCLKYFIPWTQSLEQNSNLKKKLSFSGSDSLQVSKRELELFVLLVELNNLEILK